VGMVRKGDEILQYYGGYEITHGACGDRKSMNRVGSICAVAQRLDGFVSADAAYGGGELMTPPIVFQGSRLELNVDNSALGVTKAAILDAEGNTVRGYSAARCDPIHGNHIRRTVTWRGSPDVGVLAGRPIRLHFVMRSAKLYAFQFVQEG